MACNPINPYHTPDVAEQGEALSWRQIIAFAWRVDENRNYYPHICRVKLPKLTLAVDLTLKGFLEMSHEMKPMFIARQPTSQRHHSRGFLSPPAMTLFGV